MWNQRAAAVAVVLLAAAALPAATEAQNVGPASETQGQGQGSERLVLGNDEILLTFQGKKPSITVTDVTNNSRGYKIFLQRIIEVAPGESPQGSQPVAEFPMTRAQDWNVTTREDADGVHLEMKKQGDVRFRGGPPEGVLPPPIENITGNLTQQPEPGTVNVTIVFHLYDRPRELMTPEAVGNATGNETGNETGGGNATGAEPVTVTTHEVKFDLMVDGWPWVRNEDVLALEFILVERGDGASMDDAGGADGDENATTENEVTVEQNGTRVGFFSWLPQAEATFERENGTETRAVDVEYRAAGRTSDEDMEENATESENGAKHWLVYDAPGAMSIVHDPSIGINTTKEPRRGFVGELEDVPGFGAVLAALAVAGAAASATRRKRSG